MILPSYSPLSWILSFIYVFFVTQKKRKKNMHSISKYQKISNIQFFHFPFIGDSKYKKKFKYHFFLHFPLLCPGKEEEGCLNCGDFFHQNESEQYSPAWGHWPIRKSSISLRNLIILLDKRLNFRNQGYPLAHQRLKI